MQKPEGSTQGQHRKRALSQTETVIHTKLATNQKEK
jgi:hypothetical protein